MVTIFSVSNMTYGHFRRPDSIDRLKNMSVFFGSNWSEWHNSWLLKTGITHIISNDRCVPIWIKDDIQLLAISTAIIGLTIVKFPIKISVVDVAQEIGLVQYHDLMAQGNIAQLLQPGNL